MSAAQTHGGRSIRLPALISLADPTRVHATPVFAPAFGIERQGFSAHCPLTYPRMKEEAHARTWRRRGMPRARSMLSRQRRGPRGVSSLAERTELTAPKMAKRKRRRLFWPEKFLEPSLEIFPQND